MHLVTSHKMNPVDKLFALSAVNRFLAETLVQEETNDLVLSEFARDGLGHLLALVSDKMNDVVCELDNERREAAKKQEGRE